ncbi:UbiA prenyltransferase family protein [Streptomyces bacillaris]|uniref:prenyltransferase n=1 Tax=Streptomyces bacillaris TaxID=68179 RepID=UPI0036B69DB7
MRCGDEQASAAGLDAGRGPARGRPGGVWPTPPGAPRVPPPDPRPPGPTPTARVSRAAAGGAAGVLTAAGLALAARAGRPALAVATGLAATVWAYDLRLKHTKAGPAAMAAARSLDLLLGATAATARGAGDNVAAPAGSVRDALPAALVLGAHTYGVTAVSRHEAQGGSTAVPLAVLATTAALGTAVLTAGRAARTQGPRAHRPTRPHHLTPADLLLTAFTGAYLRTAGPPLLHAALNPSPPLTQRAVGGGIRAMIPLQAALAARNGAPGSGLAVMALVPLARSLARKVSPT